MSGCSLSVTHRSMAAVDGLTGIGSHCQGHHFKFNFCLDSCCTGPVVNSDASELCYTWGELKCLHMMSVYASMSCPSQITWKKRAWTILFQKCHPSLLQTLATESASPLMNFEEEPNMSWEETFWVFNLSLRHDVLQSHKETTSDHIVVMNSIHIQPLGCWCISKACLGPIVVSLLIPKPRYTG